MLASALETAKAAVTLAQQDYDRIATLVKQGAVAEAVLDRSVDDRRKALDAVTGIEARLARQCGGRSPQRSRKGVSRKRSSRLPNTIWRRHPSSRPSRAL